MDLIYLTHLYLVCITTFVGEDKGMLLLGNEGVRARTVLSFYFIVLGIC